MLKIKRGIKQKIRNDVKSLDFNFNCENFMKKFIDKPFKKNP